MTCIIEPIPVPLKPIIIADRWHKREQAKLVQLQLLLFHPVIYIIRVEVVIGIIDADIPSTGPPFEFPDKGTGQIEAMVTVCLIVVFTIVDIGITGDQIGRYD